MNDRFTSNRRCINRLYNEYKKHSKLIVACDFDDTVFDFHGAGDTHDRVFDVLHECKKLGFYIVMWTASAPERFDMIRKYMSDKGIEVDAINENPIILPFGNQRKIYYNILLDDRAGLGQSLDVLENLIFIITNSPAESSEKEPVYSKLDLNCQQVRMDNDLPYPRTCTVCGLGPCKYR